MSEDYIYDKSLVYKPIHYSTFRFNGYPLNLIYCIYDKEVQVTDDMISGLTYLMNNMCSETDKEIMLLKFEKNKTHAEIGEKLGISKNKVSLVVRKHIKEFRSPVYFKYIDKGLSKVLTEKEILGVKDNYTNLPIYMMEGLSARSKNCLVKAGFETAGEVSEFINNYDSEIEPWYSTQSRNFRVLGKKTASEIVRWLNDHDLETAVDKSIVPEVKTFVFRKFASDKSILFEVDGDIVCMNLDDYDIPDVDILYLNTYEKYGVKHFFISDVPDKTSKIISWRFVSRLISVVLSRETL